MKGSCGIGTTGGCSGWISPPPLWSEDTAPTVDDKVLPGHVRASIRAKEEDRALIFILVRHAAHWNELMYLSRKFIGLPGEDAAGRDRVDANIGRRPIGRQITRQADQRRLHHRIRHRLHRLLVFGEAFFAI